MPLNSNFKLLKLAMPLTRPISFWSQWVVANALGELAGLGAVAAAGYILISTVGESQGISQVLIIALFFVVAGSFEGYVLGYAQAKVLAIRVPMLQGWIKATIVGAVVAWALGMMPSTIMSILEPKNSTSPPDISAGLSIILAAGLGAFAGPLLAFFQWRVLRHYVRRAIWWLPANALAWAFGMPVIFAGVHLVAHTKDTSLAVLIAAATITIAGGVVGAIHGAVLLWLCRNGTDHESAA